MTKTESNQGQLWPSLWLLMLWLLIILPLFLTENSAEDLEGFLFVCLVFDKILLPVGKKNMEQVTWKIDKYINRSLEMEKLTRSLLVFFPLIQKCKLKMVQNVN